MTFDRGRNGRNTVSLDITPLIDVVFLLLVFLLLSMTFEKKDTYEPSVIDIELAKSRKSREIEKTENIIVYLDKNGAFYLEKDKALSDAELAAALKKNARYALKADKNVAYGRVVEALDILKDNIGGNVNLIVEKTE